MPHESFGQRVCSVHWHGLDHEDETHQNLARRIRTLLGRKLGVTVSRAILHTPHAQWRSPHAQLEDRFATGYHQTVSDRFGHHLDIATTA